MSKYFLYGLLFFQSLCLFGQNMDMALVKGGEFLPLYGTDEKVHVESFLMDKYPVTNKEFLKFVKTHSKWQKSKIVALFADSAYLRTWKNDTLIGENLQQNAPVTHISWYAAKEYCKCQDKRLATTQEWEYAAMAGKKVANGRKLATYNQNILNWYETPNTFDNQVGQTYKNYWGIYDLHGLVWEWTADFNSAMINGESRNGNKGDTNAFCGAAALSASDLMNYAAFLRYAFRGSLEAKYAIKNLGFRCVKSYKPALLATVQ